jgi:hypothetical protein
MTTDARTTGADAGGRAVHDPAARFEGRIHAQLGESRAVVSERAGPI